LSRQTGSFLDRFEAGFNKVILFIAGLVAISIGFMAILIPLDLLIRSLKWGNMPWLYEGIEYALYFGIFLGAPWVLQQGAHVRVDVLISVLPKQAGARLEQIVDVSGALLCATLCYFGLKATVYHFVEGTLPDKLLVIANWYLMLGFAVAFLMLTIEFLLRARRARDNMAVDDAQTERAGF